MEGRGYKTQRANNGEFVSLASPRPDGHEVRFVRRYIEFPNGRRVQLAGRKALTCNCTALQQISIVPTEKAAVIDALSLGKRVVA
jgi:hypothetical protein